MNQPHIPPLMRNKCRYCQKTFYIFWFPRHHCRNCGASVCANDSHLLNPQDRESRICNDYNGENCHILREAELFRYPYLLKKDKAEVRLKSLS